MLNFPSHVLPAFLSLAVVASGHQTNKNPEGIAKQRRELRRIGQRSK